MLKKLKRTILLSNSKARNLARVLSIIKSSKQCSWVTCGKILNPVKISYRSLLDSSNSNKDFSVKKHISNYQHTKNFLKNQLEREKNFHIVFLLWLETEINHMTLNLQNVCWNEVYSNIKYTLERPQLILFPSLNLLLNAFGTSRLGINRLWTGWSLKGKNT